MRWLCFYFGRSFCIFPQISVHWSTGHLHRAHYSEIFTTRQLPLLFASLIRPRDAQCEWIITFVYSRTNLPCYVVFAALRMPSWVKCLLWSKMFVRWRQVWCKHGDFRLSCAHPLDSALNQRVNGRVLRHRRDSWLVQRSQRFRFVPALTREFIVRWDGYFRFFHVLH